MTHETMKRPILNLEMAMKTTNYQALHYLVVSGFLFYLSPFSPDILLSNNRGV
jgi:hypothetical protein